MAETRRESEGSNGYWLQKLEAESYQVELVISGLAIYGSLQLIEQLKALIHWVNVEISDPLLIIAYFSFVYLLIGAQFLVFTFILHFAMRALWVGLVGLASVYPGGINKESKDRHSVYFLEQLTEEFPSLRRFNEQLDRLCSLVFAFSFGMVMVMLSIALLLGAFILIDLLVAMALPQLGGWVAKGLIALLILAFIFNMLLNVKTWWDKPLVRRIHYPYNRMLNRIIYLFMRQPATYLTYTFMTNEKMSRLGGVYFLSLFIALLAFVSGMQENGILHFNRDFHIRQGSRADKFEYFEYVDQLPEGVFIYSPVLPSAEIRGDFLPLFVPTFARTRTVRQGRCGEYQPPEGEPPLEGRALRQEERQFTLDCYARLYRVFLDSVPVPDLRWRFKEHEHRGEEGIITYLPIGDLPYGEHLLQLERPYYSLEGEARWVNIPFVRVREK
jgi:hypothetical protein